MSHSIGSNETNDISDKRCLYKFVIYMIVGVIRQINPIPISRYARNTTPPRSHVKRQTNQLRKSQADARQTDAEHKEE